MFGGAPIDTNTHGQSSLLWRTGDLRRTKGRGLTMCLFWRSQRGTLVTVTPLDLGDRPPLAFATRLVHGLSARVRIADGGARQGNGTLECLYTIRPSLSCVLEQADVQSVGLVALHDELGVSP